MMTKVKVFNKKQRMEMVNKAYKNISKGAPWKLGCIIPYDGEPSMPEWGMQLDSSRLWCSYVPLWTTRIEKRF